MTLSPLLRLPAFWIVVLGTKEIDAYLNAFMEMTPIIITNPESGIRSKAYVMASVPVLDAVPGTAAKRFYIVPKGPPLELP